MQEAGQVGTLPSPGNERERDRPADQVPGAAASASGLVEARQPWHFAASDATQAWRIARQVAAQPVLRTGGAAALRLAPEELGPLRLSVEIGETGLRVIIEAARPETADLMRRHVEALRQELRQEGLGSVGVSIGGGDARNGGEAAFRRDPGEGRPGFGSPSAGLDLAAAPPAAAPHGRGAGGHLDLRF